jgi:L-alanine-DL-glutamate epimerase-like enolase superfamily enzyme
VEEIIEPTVQVRKDGTIAVAEGPGIGYEVRWDRVEKHLVSRRTLKP